MSIAEFERWRRPDSNKPKNVINGALEAEKLSFLSCVTKKVTQDFDVRHKFCYAAFLIILLKN